MISSKSNQAVTGVTVDAIYTRGAVATGVINTFVDVCKRKNNLLVHIPFFFIDLIENQKSNFLFTALAI